MPSLKKAAAVCVSRRSRTWQSVGSCNQASTGLFETDISTLPAIYADRVAAKSGDRIRLPIKRSFAARSKPNRFCASKSCPPFGGRFDLVSPKHSGGMFGAKNPLASFQL